MLSATQIWKHRGTARAETALGTVLALGAIGATSVAIVAFFLLRELRIVGALGMPLDDAWIHFTIARNLISGHGFSFNPDVPTSASTSPLWTVLLAVSYLVTRNFLAAAVFLGVFCYLATNVAAYFLALEMKADRRLALAAAILLAVTGRWVWASLSGMESTLFTALTLWGLLLYARHRRGSLRLQAVAAALLALSVLARPEGYLLLGLVIVDALIGRLAGARGRSLLGAGVHLLGGAVAVLTLALLAAAALRFAYTLGTGGGLFGNTFLAQSLPQGNGPYTGPRLVPDIWYWQSAWRSLLADNFLLGLLVPVGMVQWLRLSLHDRRVRSLGLITLVWFVVLPLLNSMIAPNLRHHERYLMQFIPLVVLFGTFGIGFLIEQTVGERWRWRIPGPGRFLTSGRLFVVVAVLCLGDALFSAENWSVQLAGDVRSIEAINVNLGTWLRDHTAPDSYVALNDIGAITFISGRRVLDTVGIAEPDILPVLVKQGREGVFGYLQQRRPDYLVIWPEWYPELAARSDIFEPVYSARMDRPLTATRDSMLGGREMVVYRAHWPAP